MEALKKAQEPYIRKAKETYPLARERFKKGLPKGESFFLTTRLRDNQGRVEQVFILVVSIEEGVINGVIYNNIDVVSGFKYGQKYSFPETEMLDWLITKPDGSEEGNFIGKFLDLYQSKKS